MREMLKDNIETFDFDGWVAACNETSKTKNVRGSGLIAEHLNRVQEAAGQLKYMFDSPVAVPLTIEERQAFQSRVADMRSLATEVETEIQLHFEESDDING